MPRPSSESKDGAGLFSFDASLVNAFADFGTSQGLATAVDDFVSCNCSGFAGVDLTTEHRLEWTILHERFVSLVELHLESFCKEHGTTSTNVFEQLRAVREGPIAEEFIPLVINMCSYDYFIRNMREADESRLTKRDALDRLGRVDTEEDTAKESVTDHDGESTTTTKGGRKSSTNLSGAYVICVDRISVEQVDAFYKYIQFPWFFRKMMLQATKSINEMVLIHVDDEELIFKYSLPFFGRESKEYFLDNVLRSKTNAIGRMQNQRSFQDGEGVKIVNEKPKFEPRGTVTNLFTREKPKDEDREMLLWSRVVRDEDGNKMAALDLWFEKVTVSESSRK